MWVLSIFHVKAYLLLENAKEEQKLHNVYSDASLK